MDHRLFNLRRRRLPSFVATPASVNATAGATQQESFLFQGLAASDVIAYALDETVATISSAPELPLVGAGANPTGSTLDIPVTGQIGGGVPTQVWVEVDENGTGSWVAQTAVAWSGNRTATQTVTATGLTASKNYAGKIRARVSNASGNSYPSAAITSGATGAGSTMGTLPVTSGLVLRLHANAGVATTAGKVTSWTDQSATGAVFSQATGTAQPALVAGAYNSKPTVRLASGQYLVAGAVITAFNTVDYTTFVVCKPASLSPSRQWPWSNEDATAKTGESIGFDNFPRYFCAHGDGTTRWTNLECTSTPSTTALHTVSLRETNGSPTKQKLFADNANGSGDATNQAANTTKPPVIGSLASAIGTEAFTGDICEIIRFNRGLSDTELASMETYFQTEWGTA